MFAFCPPFLPGVLVFSNPVVAYSFKGLFAEFFLFLFDCGRAPFLDPPPSLFSNGFFSRPLLFELTPSLYRLSETVRC